MVHLNNKYIIENTMDDLGGCWRSWCRLCANEDVDNKVNIHFMGNYQTGEDVKLTLKEALEKHFGVQSSSGDLLPKHLCSDCYSLISSIMTFNVHVERVQQMYNCLLENPTYDPCDFKLVRIKFDVADGIKGKWCNQKKPIETVSENIRNTMEECGAEEFTMQFKEESCNIESNLCEYGENSDLDNASLDQEEVLYDEEYIDNNRQTEDEDLLETMPEYSVCAEEKIDPMWTTNKRKSTRTEQKTNNYTEGITKQKRKEIELADSCEKKEHTTEEILLDDINGEEEKTNIEDFVLDVACKECGQKFDLFSTYCEHMKVTHGNAHASTYCPICDRNLYTCYSLKRHMLQHLSLEARYPIKCPECENRYTSIAQLDVHINHKHIKTKAFICEVCGFCGGTKNSLTQHMYVHNDNKPFECEVCKKKFKKKSVLNIHMDIHAPDKFVCMICGLQLNTRATLKKHMAVHSDEMRHKCDYCGKAFKHSYYLKRHLLLHTGLKPYPCNFCNLTYNNRSMCRSHMKKKHPEELALLDASGTKAYTKNIPKLEVLKDVCRTTAVNNVAAVNNGRPLLDRDSCFVCDFCDHRFSYRGNGRYHMKKKHPKEFAEMEEADKRKVKPKFKKKLVLKITEQKNQVTRAEQNNDYRVVVFGAGGVGKSSLVLRFIKGTFRESYIPTIEDTYRQVISCNKTICTLQITDTTGSHQFPAMQRLSITKGHAFILVYSVCSKQSLEELRPIWNLIKELKGQDIVNIPVMLVGNKCDESAELRNVSEAEGKAQATAWNISFMETSAKTNHNVTELFQELLTLEKTRTVSLQLDTKTKKKQKKEKKNKEAAAAAAAANGATIAENGGAEGEGGGSSGAKEKCHVM